MNNQLTSTIKLKEGTIVPVMQERLLALGKWLNINGDAIYGSKPWRAQNDTIASQIWYTQQLSGSVYAISFSWPSNSQLVLTQPKVNSKTLVTLLGYGQVNWKQDISTGHLIILLPSVPPSFFDQFSTVAWTFKLDSVA